MDRKWLEAGSWSRDGKERTQERFWKGKWRIEN